MKKFYLLVITIIFIFGFAGCSENASEKNSETKGGSGSVSVSVNKSKDKEEEIFNDEEVIKNITTTTYTWNEGSYYYAAIIAKNNSKMDCQLTANIVFKDEDGNTIGADDDIIYALEKNAEACFVVSNEEPFASLDYTYQAEKTSFYQPVASKLTCEVSTTADKAILTFKNNGEKIINSTEYQVLFMLGENVVDHNWGYVSDLNPNGTKVEESNYYNSKKGFDSIKVYYSGYTTED